MSIEIITKEDLQLFRLQLLEDLKALLLGVSPTTTKENKWLRSAEVRKLLRISPNTLQNLRIHGRLPYTKMGNIHYYPAAGIEHLLSEGLNKKEGS